MKAPPRAGVRETGSDDRTALPTTPAHAFAPPALPAATTARATTGQGVAKATVKRWNFTPKAKVATSDDGDAPAGPVPPAPPARRSLRVRKPPAAYPQLIPTPAKKIIPLQALGRSRRHGYSARPLTTLVKGLFWKAMHATKFQGSTDYSTLLDSEAWGTGGGLDAKTSEAITCQQLVIEHHAGRGGPLTADRAMRTAVQSITDDIFKESGQTTCPACDSPLDEHTTGEVFMNALQVGHGLRFHTDEPPPPSTGSACETTIIVLLRPASEGGLLRVSRLADGTATRPDVSGGHPYRDTDVLPLEAPGDTTWLDGRNAAHKVTKIKAGTRVSLCIGVMCPPWHTHEAPAPPTSQGEEGTDATQPTEVTV